MYNSYKQLRDFFLFFMILSILERKTISYSWFPGSTQPCFHKYVLMWKQIVVGNLQQSEVNIMQQFGFDG